MNVNALNECQCAGRDDRWTYRGHEQRFSPQTPAKAPESARWAGCTFSRFSESSEH